MRVLFSAPASVGHIFPLVPVAQALRAAGHDVLFAGQTPIAQLESTGLPAVDVGDGTDVREAFARVLPDVNFADDERPDDETMALAARGFAQHGRVTVDNLLAVATGWRPDVVVHAPFQPAAPLVAAKLGIPAVVHNFGVSSEGMAGLLAGLFADEYRAHGLEGPARSTVLDVVPASLGGDGGGWRVRYVPFNGGGTVPAELVGRGARRRIAVTLGTVVPQWEGVAPIRRVLEQAAGLDAEILLAVGDADLAPLGPLPANVRPLPWVPLAQLLDACDAVVHHGGSGTMMTAAATGVPQLILPQGADHFINVAAAETYGFALRSSAEAVDAELLGRLLDDEALRKAAGTVRAEIEALPSPAELVANFEALLG